MRYSVNEAKGSQCECLIEGIVAIPQDNPET